MKKSFKGFVLALLVMFAGGMGFGQATFRDLGNMPGAAVVYRDDSGNFLNIVNVQDSYIVRYRNTAEQTAVSAGVQITRGYYTEFELLKMYEGTPEEYESIILPKIRNLFLYTDMNLMQNLPESFEYQYTRTDLYDLEHKKIALVNLIVPITNLVWEKDGDGKVLMQCIQFGFVSPDEIDAFLNSADIPEPVIRKMRKVKVQKTVPTQIGNFEIKLPRNFVLSDGFYVLPDTTKRDSVIYTYDVTLDSDGFADIYAYVVYDVLSTSMEACIVPESFKIEKKGQALIVTYDVISYDYWELNTIKQCFVSKDQNHYDVIRIHGYSSFIELNKAMYDDIIKTAKVKPQSKD